MIYSDTSLIKIQNKIHASFLARSLAILILGFLYFSFARISMYTAIGPGFATPIWPSAGIALSFLLLFGYAVWPGILLGSFLHNVLIFPTNNDWHTWIVAVLTGITIGIGTVLEIILATYFIKDYIASPFPVNKVKNVILIFAIAIGSSIVAASIGIGVLALAAVIPHNQFFISWWTWWIGDSMGILVFTPLILSWTFDRKIHWSFSDIVEVVVILALTILVLYFAFVHEAPVNFALIPLALWASFRFNFRGSTLYLAAVTIAMAFLTSFHSSFRSFSLIESYFLLEIFIITLTMITLIVSAALNERKTADDLLVVYNKSLEQTIDQRTQDLQKRLSQLQAMQKVISDQEKLAYLGELATGIAHDIKDPLNLINSLTNKCRNIANALTDRMHSPEKIQPSENLLVQMDDNLKSISDNCKKAFEFAQGLIYHSKDKPGYFQMIDINNLCEEYLKLASHEMYSTDPWFDIQIKKDFDPSVGLISAIPQDISVVLFNLLSNANYAVHEKKKRLDKDYQPKVLIRTQNMGNKIAIIVRDNGIGIPEDEKERIFTPFFSTKPLGQGLGLGLSSSHEIVEKHEGKSKLTLKKESTQKLKSSFPRHRQIKLNEEF